MTGAPLAESAGAPGPPAPGPGSPRRRWSLALLGLAVGLTALVVGLRGTAEAGESQGEGTPPSTTPDPSRAELLAEGQQLYLTACVSCHGIAGQGTADGPDVTQSGEAAADFYLRTGRMPLAAPAPQAPQKPVAYTNEQIEALVAFVGSLGDGPAIPDVNTDDPAVSLSEGRDLFLANCAPCHNSAGIGGAISYGRFAPSLQQIEATQVGEAIRIGPGEMPQFGDEIFTDTQVNAIAKYVEYLRSPEDPGGADLGYTGPVAEGFVALLIGLVILVLIVRWITGERGTGDELPDAPDDEPDTPSDDDREPARA